MTALGFYHCSVKSVGRAKGRSVVAAAAYRHGERLYDEISGQTFDYRARGGVVESFIIAPDHAPSWAHNCERLWNEAERAEGRANGRLATEIEIALPYELNHEQRKELLRDHFAPIVERYGVAVDIAIHEPGEGRDHRNVHAHVLVTHRVLGENGFGELSNARTVQKNGRKPETIYGIAANSNDVSDFGSAGDAIDDGLHAASGFSQGLAKFVENILSGIFSFFVSEPKLTPLQAELAARANEELAEARAIRAEMREHDAAQIDIIYQRDGQRHREEDLERETAERERQRERERDRY